MPISVGEIALIETPFAPKKLIDFITASYFLDLAKKIPALVGSMELIGNPTLFVENVWIGLRDLFVVPAQELVNGPQAFLISTVYGSQSFLTHLTSAVFGSLRDLSTSVSRNLDHLSLDPTYISAQRIRRSQTPPGISSGLHAVGFSVWSGLSGLVRHPVNGIRNFSATEFGKGLGKGVVGVVTKPLGGVFELVSVTSQTIVQSTSDDSQLVTSHALILEKNLQPFNFSNVKLSKLVFGSKFDLFRTTWFHVYFNYWNLLDNFSSKIAAMTTKQMVCVTLDRLSFVQFQESFVDVSNNNQSSEIDFQLAHVPVSTLTQFQEDVANNTCHFECKQFVETSCRKISISFSEKSEYLLFVKFLQIQMKK